jgi:hypothetical protein
MCCYQIDHQQCTDTWGWFNTNNRCLWALTLINSIGHAAKSIISHGHFDGATPLNAQTGDAVPLAQTTGDLCVSNVAAVDISACFVVVSFETALFRLSLWRPRQLSTPELGFTWILIIIIKLTCHPSSPFFNTSIDCQC